MERVEHRGPRVWTCCLVLCAALEPSALRADLTPLGPEFQLNAYTTGPQQWPDVGFDAEGNFVVVWQSLGSGGDDTSGYSVQGQRFAPDGTPVGAQFQVNTYTTNRQGVARVAVTPAGDFVVVWSSDGSHGSDSDSYSVHGQVFASDGSPVGDNFQVNTSTGDTQFHADVAADAVGEFVVVWRSDESAGNDTFLSSIQGQRYDGDGNPLGGEFQVNTYTTNIQSWPAVAASPAGDFVVVWQSDGSSGSDTNYYSVQAQCFDAGGQPVGAQFQVNTVTTQRQFLPDVAMGPDGGFVVAWRDYAPVGNEDLSVQARRYDAGGNPLGPQFQLNSYTSGLQIYPRLAIAPDGGFLAVWTSTGSAGDDQDLFSVQARLFDAEGAPQGADLQVNESTAGFQFLPSAAVDSAGRFLATWQSDASTGSDTDGASVQGRFLAGPIFADGFESGDTSGWDQTVQ